jgi:hypothetical protein
VRFDKVVLAGLAAPDVLGVRYSLKVFGVDAVADSAQVVQL